MLAYFLALYLGLSTPAPNVAYCPTPECYWGYEECLIYDYGCHCKILQIRYYCTCPYQGPEQQGGP